MAERVHAAALLAIALAVSACRKTPVTVPTDASSSAAAEGCPHPTIIGPHIRGPITGGRGAPREMVVGVEPWGPADMVTKVDLAEALFGAEYGNEDLCADDGSTLDRIAMSCLKSTPLSGEQGGTAISRISVRRDVDRLSVIVDGQASYWSVPPSVQRCYELRGYPKKSDLEGLRKTFLRDHPRCDGGTGGARTRVTMRFDIEPTAHRCRPGATGTDAARVSLVVKSKKERSYDLGMIAGLCESTVWHRSPFLNGLVFWTIDDERYLYQLGDRVYWEGKDQRIHASELECGDVADFNAVVAGHPEIRESEPP